MELKKGTHRIVFIFPRFGFVIKLPRFYIWFAIKGFFKFIYYRDWKFLKKWLKYDVVVLGGFKNQVYKGIHDNWQEYKFYSITKNVFLQPTHFSLYGLVNIQSYGESKKTPFDTLLQYFMVLTDGDVFDDNHHFANYRNFCFEDGKIKITDYGSKRTQAVIEKWGEKIVTEFQLEKVKEKEETA